jgi:hypothetical protein
MLDESEFAVFGVADLREVAADLRRQITKQDFTSKSHFSFTVKAARNRCSA